MSIRFMELSNDISVLKDLIKALLVRVEVLESENAALKAENAELRSRLNLKAKTATNLHPPTDCLKSPAFLRDQPKRAAANLATKARRSRWLTTRMPL